METIQPDGWQIVLIDDEADIREVMSLTLMDAGYKVKTAADGKAGLDLVKKISPQIVITDIRMPQVSGLEVLETIKQTGSDTEVIVVTAFGEMDLAIRALQLDASDFITKPINDESLHLALKRASERYTARKQVRDYTALLEKENSRTARELSEAIAIQKNLIDSAIDGIVGCNPDGVIVTFNRSMEQLLGYRKETVINRKTLKEIFAPGTFEKFYEELTGSEFGGKNRLLLYETTLANSDNRTVPIQLSATRLSEKIPEIHIVCFFRDLREIITLERNIRDQARILHQDKMMSLGKLAASVAHEINNPLSGILNYIRLMLRKMDRGRPTAEEIEKFGRYLDLMEKETDRCSQIVSSLLTFSRKSPLAYEKVSVDDLIRRCTILSRHKLELCNISLNVDIKNGLPAVYGDFNQLQQCLINLIFNAVDAMPEGGTLSIEGKHHQKNGRIAIRVKDTGIGISKEDLAHIFEPFFTTKQEGYGVGLGLSTTYGIIEKHRGSIKATSAPGKGTTFTIELPCRVQE